MNEYYNPYYPNTQNEPQITNNSNININPYVSEQAFIENLLQANRGKVGKFHMSFPNRNDKEKTFTGVIEQAGKDHIVISEPKTGKWHLLLLIYLDYVEFEEKINYIQNL